jgi:cell fate (sporulation/competence/biofilm development) regulator YmcA (YheA/YmcA/DUF963 family)
MSKKQALETLSEKYTAIRMERDSMPYCDTMQDKVLAIANLIQLVRKANKQEVQMIVEQYGLAD